MAVPAGSIEAKATPQIKMGFFHTQVLVSLRQEHGGVHSSGVWLCECRSWVRSLLLTPQKWEWQVCAQETLGYVWLWRMPHAQLVHVSPAQGWAGGAAGQQEHCWLVWCAGACAGV